MRRNPRPDDPDELDAWGTTEGEPETCWECDGSGYSYGTCLTCGGYGWLRRYKPSPRLPVPTEKGEKE